MLHSNSKLICKAAEFNIKHDMKIKLVRSREPCVLLLHLLSLVVDIVVRFTLDMMAVIIFSGRVLSIHPPPSTKYFPYQ